MGGSGTCARHAQHTFDAVEDGEQVVVGVAVWAEGSLERVQTAGDGWSSSRTRIKRSKRRTR